MAYSVKYGKPNMTNLPSELGMGIFKQIMDTPKPDFAKMQAEALGIEREIIKIRETENADRIAAK